MKGKFIVLEGGEGGGKSLQIRELSGWLDSQGIENIVVREPGGNRLGREIRSILLSPDSVELDSLSELFLYSADRRIQYENVIRPNLEYGTWVLSDRSWPSTQAYQGFAGKVDEKVIKNMINLSTSGLVPNLLYIIDVHPSVGLKMEENPDRFAMKKFDYHLKVWEGYNSILDDNLGFAVRVPYIKNKQKKMQGMIRRDIIKKCSEWFDKGSTEF